MQERTKDSSVLDQIIAALREAQSIIVVSHYHPDPDAYASSCAVANSLEKLGKNVFIVNVDGGSERFHFIKGVNRISPSWPDVSEALVVACDCGDIKRVGEQFVPKVKAANIVISIDHHHFNDNFGTLNYVDEDASSTSELIFEILEKGSFPVDQDIASGLLAGLMADSGSFRYSNTSERTFEMARRLVACGAVPGQVALNLYSRNSLSSTRLQAESLAALKLHYDGRVCELFVSEEMVKRCNASSEDTENLVEKGRDIDGVEVSFLARWDHELWRVSLRSRDSRYDVSRVARKFGGGGHVCAAAFRRSVPYEELKSSLLEEIGLLFK